MNRNGNGRHQGSPEWGPAGPSVTRLGVPSVSRLAGVLAVPVRTAAFWVAVVVPLAYPPVLLDGGDPQLLLLAGVVGLHAVALSLGHDHRQS